MTILINPFVFGGGGGPGPGGSVATLTVPAGKVASTLTDFVVRVKLNDLPSGWWASGDTDGSDVRVKHGGSVIPFDLVYYNGAAMIGELYFKHTLTTSDNVFTIEQVGGSSALPATDTNGRNAVWADYDFAMIAEGGLINRNGGAAVSETGTNAYIGAIGRSPDVSAHQGVAYDPGTDCFIVIDTDELVRYNRSWVEQNRETTPLADTGISGVVHSSDGCVVGGELFICVDDYPGTSIQHVAVFDAVTLAFDRSYNIVANGHQIASICSDGTYFYTVAYNAGTDYLTSIQKWNSDWTHNSTITTASIGSKQGIEIHDGYFWISRGSVDPFNVYRVNLDGSGAVIGWGSNYTTSSSGECEGICSDGRDLFHLFDHGSNSYVYQLVATNDPRAGQMFDGGRALAATGLPLRTSWTVGGTGFLARTAGYSYGVASYGTNNATDGNRAALAVRDASTDRWGIWNSTDGWLEDTSVAAGNQSLARVHHTQATTVERKIWRDGVLRATDSGCAQRPVSPGDTLHIGTDDTSYNGNWFGWLNRIYLRNGVLSADWLAAEYESWESPSTFYALT